MKKSLFTLLVVMLFGTAAFAQNPEPGTTPITDRHYPVKVYSDGNGTLAGLLYIDGELVTTYNWEIGVYDENTEEFTSSIPPYYFPTVSEYPVYSYTFAGYNGDLLTLRLYNHDTGEEVEYICSLRITYQMNMTIGSLNADDLCQIQFFSSAEDMVFDGLQDNNWSNVANWTANGEPIGRLPQVFENVTIAAPCTLDMDAEVASITVESALTIGSGDEEAYTLTGPLTIKDGGQFFAPAGSQYSGTIEKEIKGYNGSRDNYYLLSMPVTDYNFADAGMLEGNYDLYFFEASADNDGPVDIENGGEDGDFSWWLGEWRNYKFYTEEHYYTPEQFVSPRNSYLYANQEGTTLSFEGSFYTAATKRYGNTDIAPNTSADWTYVTTVGNPYPSNAVVTNGNMIQAYYIMNVDDNGNRNGDVIVLNPGNVIITPATSLFVVMKTSGIAAQRYVQFAPTQEEANVRSSAESAINIELYKDNALEDRAYVKMGEGDNTMKISLRNDGSKIFIPQNGKKNAIAYTGESSVMPLCFTSTESGIHTISVKVENMDCSYLHLIDNVTGADIDLLRTPKYSFNADDSNYATRFKLVFDEQATDEIAESFAFISNGELMINNSGEATLQIMDITGRILSTENIQNCYSKSLNLSAGVYVVRLTNGNDVKAQKIVVE